MQIWLFFQFDFWNRRKVYTCSIDGTFLSREFREGSGAQDHEVKKFLETGSYERWYTSFDVSFVGKCHTTLQSWDKCQTLLQTKVYGFGHDDAMIMDRAV